MEPGNWVFGKAVVDYANWVVEQDGKRITDCKKRIETSVNKLTNTYPQKLYTEIKKFHSKVNSHQSFMRTVKDDPAMIPDKEYAITTGKGFHRDISHFVLYLENMMKEIQADIDDICDDMYRIDEAELRLREADGHGSTTAFKYRNPNFDPSKVESKCYPDLPINEIHTP